MPKGYTKDKDGNIIPTGWLNIGRKHTEETKKKMRESISKRNGPWNKGLTKEIDERLKLRSEMLKGTIASEETKKKMSLIRKGKRPEGLTFAGKKHSEDTKKKMSISMTGKKKPTLKKIVSIRMTEWQSLYMNSLVKNPSKPQVELFNLVKKLCYCAELNYPVIEVNRCIDIAIPFHKIAIEYDGSYWHQDEEKDKQRQKQIESLGWRFIRFRDYIPSLEELRDKIYNI